MDRNIEEGHIMLIAYRNDFRRDNFRETCKIIEVRNLEVDIEVIIKTTTLEEVEVGLGKDNIQVILQRMTEAVAIGLDQV